LLDELILSFRRNAYRRGRQTESDITRGLKDFHESPVGPFGGSPDAGVDSTADLPFAAVLCDTFEATASMSSSRNFPAKSGIPSLLTVVPDEYDVHRRRSLRNGTRQNCDDLEVGILANSATCAEKGQLMWPVIRNLLAVIVGFIAASAVMMIVETINGHVLFPELARMAGGATDRDQIRAIMANAPVGALVVVIVGWVLASVAGGFLTTLISRKARAPALALGILLTLAGIANNLMLPPPLWFWFATLVVFFPATYLGARLVRQKPATSDVTTHSSV
jgi:hypothetical protein